MEDDNQQSDTVAAEVSVYEELVAQRKPLKFLVHVPKTAGSTINAALKLRSPNGKIHCESIINKEDEFKQAANSLDWLSGHVDLASAIDALAKATDRPVQYFACMRQPRSQVASHYNWLIEIFHKGSAFYEQHPPRVKGISEAIRSSSNKSASEIIENLQKFPQLFLNFQSRIILGRGFNWNTGKIFQRLQNYTMLVDNIHAWEIASSILEDEDFDFTNKNESSYHFDKSVFDDPLMLEFLHENNTLDEILYEIGPSKVVGRRLQDIVPSTSDEVEQSTTPEVELHK